MGVFWLLLAGSSWHKDSWLPCTERSYYITFLDIEVDHSARHCNKLRQIDISSCNNMTDNSLRALGRGCPQVSDVVFAAARINEDKHYARLHWYIGQ